MSTARHWPLCAEFSQSQAFLHFFRQKFEILHFLYTPKTKGRRPHTIRIWSQLTRKADRGHHMQFFRGLIDFLSATAIPITYA